MTWSTVSTILVHSAQHIHFTFANPSRFACSGILIDAPVWIKKPKEDMEWLTELAAHDERLKKRHLPLLKALLRKLDKWIWARCISDIAIGAARSMRTEDDATGTYNKGHVFADDRHKGGKTFEMKREEISALAPEGTCIESTHEAQNKSEDEKKELFEAVCLAPLLVYGAGRSAVRMVIELLCYGQQPLDSNADVTSILRRPDDSKEQLFDSTGKNYDKFHPVPLLCAPVRRLDLSGLSFLKNEDIAFLMAAPPSSLCEPKPLSFPSLSFSASFKSHQDTLASQKNCIDGENGIENHDNHRNEGALENPKWDGKSGRLSQVALPKRGIEHRRLLGEFLEVLEMRGLEHLTPAVLPLIGQRCGSLTRLDLGMCTNAITDASLAALALGLGGKSGRPSLDRFGQHTTIEPPIRKLSIANASHVTDCGLRVLGDALGASLNDLNLYSCFRISDVGIMHIGNRRLDRINWCGSYKVTDAARRRLVSVNERILTYNRPRDFGVPHPAEGIVEHHGGSSYDGNPYGSRLSSQNAAGGSGRHHLPAGWSH